MTSFQFKQVDVFSANPFYGNPIAVVLNAQALSDDGMKKIADWLNLPKTVFMLPPTLEQADYRVRMFSSTGAEIHLIGHTTLGACCAWLAAGGQPRDSSAIVQQLDDSTIELKKLTGVFGECNDFWAFKAGGISRLNMAEADLELICKSLGIEGSQIQATQMIDNFDSDTRFMALLLDDAQAVRLITPQLTRLAQAKINVGIIAPYRDKQAENAPDFEVRYFMPGAGEDEAPITGSLNAALAEWLIQDGLVPERYVVSQGSAIGLDGRLLVEQDPAGDIWVGGHATICIDGVLAYPQSMFS